jgi:hypothetical protein
MMIVSSLNLSVSWEPSFMTASCTSATSEFGDRTSDSGFSIEVHRKRIASIGNLNCLRSRLRRRLVKACAALIALAAITVSPGLAQTTPTTLRAETFVVPPFVMERGDALTGFSIDLWEEIAARLKVKTAYEKAPNISVGLEALRSKKSDIGVSAILMTVERDKEFDFSFPIMEAGQQVMVLIPARVDFRIP